MISKKKKKKKKSKNPKIKNKSKKINLKKLKKKNEIIIEQISVQQWSINAHATVPLPRGQIPRQNDRIRWIRNASAVPSRSSHRAYELQKGFSDLRCHTYGIGQNFWQGC